MGSKPAFRESRVVLFDLFHTLVAIELHSPMPPESWEILGVQKDLWSVAWGRQSSSRLRGDTKDIRSAIALAVQDIGIDIPDKLIDKAAEARNAKFRRALTEVEPEVLEVLGTLQQSGRKLGLVSNADVCEVAAWCDSPLKAFFPVAVFSCDVGFVKPEAAIYEACCSRLEVEPRECLFVGDGGSREFESARALGMYAVQATWILDKFWPGLAATRGQSAHAHISRLGELMWLLQIQEGCKG